MPFDFGVSLDFASDFDVSSIVDNAGTEFLSADTFSFTDFDIPLGDVADLGGFDVAGSFAGSASWFDTFNSGDILSKIPSVSDFSLPSLPDSFPSLSSLKDVASTVSNDLGGFVKDAQAAFATYQKVAPVVNLAASALGIQNPVNAIIAPVSQVVGIAGTAAGVAGSVSTGNVRSLATNPAVVSAVYSAGGTSSIPVAQTIGAGVSAYNIASAVGSTLPKAKSLVTTDPNASNARDVATGLPINTPREVDQYGLGILTDQESIRLTRNAPLINSLTDPGTAQTLNYDTAVESQAALTPLVASYRDAIVLAEQNIQSNNANIAAIEAELRDEFLPDSRREELEAVLAANYENNAIQQNNIITNQERLGAANTSLAADRQVITATNASTVNTAAPVATTAGGDQFTAAYDPETSQWSVFNNTTGVTTQSNLTEQEAILAAQNLNITNGTTLSTNEAVADAALAEAVAANQATNTDTSPTEIDVQALLGQARNQQTVRDLRQNKADSSDWRVRLRLAPNSTYLYNDPSPGILAPLASTTGTDGVIFPYTPNIETAYKANYDGYDLTHSNYRGYFYKNSHVDAINLRASFTAQDTEEANYLLAVIHFFRSATKMFYGQDAQRGSPPPMVYLSGYGNFQFNEHPCVISQFNYTLPSEVDYIRAGSALDASTNMLGNRVRQSTPGNPLSYAINRLLNNNLTKGALDNRPNIVSNLAVGEPTYVPTKMEISITLLPMQSRQQVSKQFSLQAFANGNQLKGGFW